MIPPIVFLHKLGKRLADLHSLLLPSECWYTKTESGKVHTQQDYSDKDFKLHGASNGLHSNIVVVRLKQLFLSAIRQQSAQRLH